MAKEYKDKKGATGKKYTTVGDVIKVTYTDGSTRVVCPTDKTYAATKRDMEKDIASKKWYKPAGNSKTTAETAVGKGVTDGIITTAEKVKQNEQYSKTMQQRRGLVKNDNIIDAVAHGGETGLNTAVSGIKSGAVGMAQTAADVVGADKTADALGRTLRQMALESAARQQAINAKYNTNFSGIAKGVSDVTAGAVGMIPTVASFALTPQGKLAALGKAGQFGAKALGFAPLALQAGGGGMNQALNEGADLDAAKQYGALTAAKEIATELPFASIKYVPGVKNVGELVAEKLANQTAKKVAAAAANMAGEGAEEALSEIVDPFLQRATYNEDAENASAKDVAYAALLGGLTAGALNAGIKGAETAPNVVKNLPNTQKVIQNDQNRAFEALHGQKMGQNQTISAQKAQNGVKQEIVNRTIENIIKPQNMAQKQSSQVDFQKNQQKTLEMSERTFENVGDKNVKAYQQENPAVKPFYQETANNLLADLQEGIKGGRDAGIDPETRNVTTMGGWQRQQSEPIERMLRDGMTYNQIEDGLQRIVEDHGKENTANAKRAELYIDDAVRKGYRSVVEGDVPVNRAFAYRGKSRNELLEIMEQLENSFTGNQEQDAAIISEMETVQNLLDGMQQKSTVAENPTVTEESSEHDRMADYEDADQSQLPKDVLDFWEKATAKSGLNIRIVNGLSDNVNGMYRDGIIYLNANRITDADTIRTVTAHEVYHAMKNTNEFRDLQDVALDFYRTINPNLTNADLVRAKIEEYGSEGVQLTEDEAYEELTADFIEVALSEPKVAERIWTEKPTLAQRILWFIEDLLFDFQNRKLSDLEYEQKAILEQAQRMYSDGLQSMQYQGRSSETGETRYMFAGENSRTADREALARAQRMEADGADMETIRQQTGWFKSKVTGNKWAYEISDKGVEFSRTAPRFPTDFKAQEIRKQMTAAIKENDLEKYSQLQKQLKALPTDTTPRRDILMDWLSHPELYEAYPELRNAPFKLDENMNMNGSFDGRTIRVKSSLDKMYTENGIPRKLEIGDTTDTMLHEIQHAIQKKEGFPNGSNPWQWENVIDGENLEVEILQSGLDFYLEEIGLKDFVKSQLRRVRNGEIDMERYWKELDTFKRNSEYGDTISMLEDNIAYYRENGVAGRTAFDLYENTAGEIMARDTSRRHNLDAEQRRQQQPKMGDKNTVYASYADSYSIDTKKVREQFAKQVDEVLSGKNFESSHLMLGKTPKALKYVGFPNLPVFMTARHVYTMANESGKYKNANYHGMGADLVKQLPEAIERPLLIAESNTRDDSVVLLTKLQDKQGQPVIAAVKFNGDARSNGIRVEANILTSAYGKGNINSLFNEENLLYINKKGVHELRAVPGLQLPNNIITNESFDGNVTRFREKVKSSMNSQKSADSTRYSLSSLDKNYMDALNRGDMETAQQMVNEAAEKAGYGKRLYHQTGNLFTRFNTDNQSAGKYDHETPTGIFLKPDDRDIGLAGKRQMSLLANMKNPLHFTDRHSLSYYWGKNIPGYADITQRISENDEKYQALYDEADERDTELYKKLWEDKRQGLITREQFRKMLEDEEHETARVLKEWQESNNALRLEAKGLIDAYMQDSGYDGVVIDYDAGSFGRSTKSYIVFRPEQVKQTDTITYDDEGNIIPLSQRFDADSPDIRYSTGSIGGTNSRYQEMIDRYGSIKPGENPNGTNRNVQVPKQTSDWDKTRKWTRTAMEAEQVDDITTGMIADDLTADIQSGRFIYEPTSNKQQVDRANSLINQTGWEQQAEQFRNKYLSGESMSADDIALGERLIQEAQKAGEYQTAVDLIADVAAIGTEAGRSVQALKILKRLTPEGQLMALKRIEQRINGSLVAQGKQSVALPEGIVEEMLQARGPERQAEIWDKGIQALANQVPATLADKINAWRYLAMLSNPRTHIRNMVGNATMRTVMGVKNVIQTGAETVLSPLGIERTAAIRVPKEYRKFAEWDYENHAKNMLEAGGGRYNDEIGLVSQNKQIFNNRYLEGARKLNSNLLDAEDMIFKKTAYIDAMSRYMYANGLSPSVLQSRASRTGATYEQGQNFAVEQAKKATFQEASKLAQKLSEIESMNNVSKIVMGAIVPFKKTPVNILKRGFEYSPVGIMNGLKKAVVDIKKGDVTPAEAIDALSAGLTGTGIMMLGYFMASQGLLSGGADDDDQRKARYDSQMGSQNYALVLPDGSTYTIDWLAPSVMPLMVGAELQKQLAGDVVDSDNATGITRALEALTKVGNPVLEMSMLQGLTDALQSYNSGTGQFLSDFITSAATSYGGQFIPAPVGALTRTVDDIVRSSYSPKDSQLTKEGETFLRQQRSKIPSLPVLNELGITSESNEASIDVWGNERKREFAGDAASDVAMRVINNFINPGTYSSNKRTELDYELDELYEATGNSNVLPKSAASYIDASEQNPKVYLNSEEYTRFAKTKGQKSQRYVEGFVNSAVYSSLDDEAKADIIADLYSLANYEAKKEALAGRGIDYLTTMYEKALQSGVEPYEYYATKARFGGKWSDYDDAAKFSDYADRMQMLDDKFVEVYDALGDLKADKDKNGKSVSGSRQEKIESYLNSELKAGNITKEQWWYFYTKEYSSKAKNSPYSWIREANK